MHYDDQVIDTQPSEAITALQEMPETPVEETPTTPPPPQHYEEDKASRNFREMRQRLDRIEQERDEALRVARELRQREQQEDLEINLGPDDLMEGKHASKMQKKLRLLEDQIRYQQQQSEALAVESRIRAQYPDFDKIVSKENLETLSSEYPEVAQTIYSSQDLYNKAASAYTIIKRLNIENQRGNEPRYSYAAEKEAAQRNAAKPKPLASVAPQQGNSPLSRANDFGDLTKELKEQLWKDMQDSMKGLK